MEVFKQISNFVEGKVPRVLKNNLSVFIFKNFAWLSHLAVLLIFVFIDFCGQLSAKKSFTNIFHLRKLIRHLLLIFNKIQFSKKLNVFCFHLRVWIFPFSYIVNFIITLVYNSYCEFHIVDPLLMFCKFFGRVCIASIYFLFSCHDFYFKFATAFIRINISDRNAESDAWLLIRPIEHPKFKKKNLKIDPQAACKLDFKIITKARKNIFRMKWTFYRNRYLVLM